jgi:uncharacterized damage-inducible protein DinB
MKIHEHAALYARYNAWAYERLYAALEPLSDEDYTRDVRLFFGSIHRTLNHLLLTHRLWAGRLMAEPESFWSLGEEIVHERLQLQHELLLHARAWADFLATVPRERFEGTVKYRDLKGVARELAFAPLAHHVTNHATHHRGQVTAVLSQLGAALPELDYPYFLADPAQGG